jgi:hypothetical protein
MKKAGEQPESDLPITSSAPLDLPEEQKALFREVLGVLEERQLPFAVGGGFALQQHTGVSRFTKDLDIFVRRRRNYGKTTAGIPVHNVAITLLQSQQSPGAHRIFDV